MKINIMMLLLPVCIALAGGAAYADTVLIKYRSGNVQAVRLDEPSGKIVSISYQEDNASEVEPPSSHPAKGGTAEKSGEAAAPTQKSTATPQTKGKPSVRIEWAQPVE